jgi:hypothetical protein
VVEKHRIRWRLVRNPLTLSSGDIRNFVATFNSFNAKRCGYGIDKGVINTLDNWQAWISQSDNWSKHYLSCIAFDKLRSELFPGYTILSTSKVRFFHLIQPYFDQYQNDSILSAVLAKEARELGPLFTHEDKALIFKVCKGETFDFLGYRIYDGGVDRCFIELKSVSLWSFKANKSPSLSKAQRDVVLEVAQRRFNVYVVMFVYLPGQKIKVLVSKAVRR